MKAKPIYKEDIGQAYTFGETPAAGRSKSRYLKDEEIAKNTEDYQKAKEEAKAVLEIGLTDCVYLQRWNGQELAKEYELKAGYYTLTTKSRGKAKEQRPGYPGELLGDCRTYEKAERLAREIIHEDGRPVVFVQRWTKQGGDFVTEYALRTHDPITAKEHGEIMAKYEAAEFPPEIAETLAEMEEIRLSNQRIEARKKRQAQRGAKRQAEKAKGE